MEATKFLLSEQDIPQAWYNIVQDLPTVGREALDGSVRNDIKAKVMNGVIRV